MGNADGLRGWGLRGWEFCTICPLFAYFFNLQKFPRSSVISVRNSSENCFLPKRQKTPPNRKTHQAQNLTETRRKFPQVPLRARPPDTPDHPKVHFAGRARHKNTSEPGCSDVNQETKPTVQKGIFHPSILALTWKPPISSRTPNLRRM